MRKPNEVKWTFSAAMLCGYLAVFHLWMHLDRTGIVITGLVWAVVFGAAAWRWRRSQFVTRMDAQAHGIVILDVVLEAVLIPVHDHYGFYWCALAFAAVIGGYRVHELRKEPAIPA